MRTRNLLLTLSALVVTASAFAQNDLSSRLATLEAFTVNGTSREQNLYLADLYIQVGRFYEASKLAEGVLQRSADDPEAIAVRDRAQRGLRAHNARALADAEARVREGGATDNDRLALADASFDAGKYSEAADIYAALPPGMLSPEAKLRRARALAWSSRLDEAERAYSDLLATKKTAELELEYGRVLSWMGAVRPAQTVLQSAHDALHSEASAMALANARAWSGDRRGALQFLQDFTRANPGAKEAAQLARELAASPELTVEQLNQQTGAEPFNLAPRLELARLQVEAGRYGEALRTIQFIRDHSSQDVPGLDELERSANERRRADIATLDTRRKSLQVQASGATAAQNAPEMLSLAKAYNGLGAYDHSIPLYQNYLALRPNDFDARVQYARVLSWDRRYRAAAREYERLLQDHPDRADLRYEYGSVLSYDGRFARAIDVLRTVTTPENDRQRRLYSDVPVRAHYNIGQIYRWHNWTDSALEEETRALALDPGYGPAAEELNLLRYRRPGATLQLQYSSARTSSGFNLRRTNATAQKWISDRTAVDLMVGRDEFTHLGQSVDANVLTVGGLYRLNDHATARGRIGSNFYDRGLGARPFFGVGAEFRPTLQSRAAVDFNHYDLVYDVFAFSSLGGDPASRNESLTGTPLTINDFRGHYDYTTDGPWSFLADASYGSISDSNARQAAHGLVAYTLFRRPFVALKADGRWLRYDFRTPRYWSPTEYHSITGVLQVGQDLKRFSWNAEFKLGTAHEPGHDSDVRAALAYASVPLTPLVSLVGGYNYGRSGRFNSVTGGAQGDFVNYWQRTWYLGIQLRQLRRTGEPNPVNPYYFEPTSVTTSPVIPPETH